MIQNHRKRTHASTSRAARRATAGLAAVALATTSFALTSPTFATSTVDVPRTSGADRYATSAAISALTVTSDLDVVIATGTTFPDGLTASTLAGSLGTTVLLVPTTGTLPNEIKTEITRLGANRGHIVGGVNAISTDMENQLKTAGLTTTTRYAGVDRYDTAREVAKAVSAVFLDDSKVTAFVATGEEGKFADALAASGAAWSAKIPLVLTNGNFLNASAKVTFNEKSIKRVILVGGTATISANVEAEMVALGIEVVRVAGQTREETATLLATKITSDADFGFTNTGAVLTRGGEFADALSSGPYSGVKKHPILFADATLSASTSAYLTAHAATIATIRVVGGTNAIPDSVLQAAKTAAGGAAANQGITVTPSAAAVKSVSTLVTGETNRGGTTYTFAAPSGATAVNIALLDAANVINTAGVITFRSVTPLATTLGTSIESVNGAVLASAVDGAGNVTTNFGTAPVSGSVTFTVDSVIARNVIPVVWVDTAGKTSTQLDFATAPTATVPQAPSEVFGIGGAVRWIPNDNLGGLITGADEVITYVNKTEKYFATTVATYRYDTNDSFYVSGTGSTIPRDLAYFEARLTVGDSLAGTSTSTYAPTAAQASLFRLVNDQPGLVTLGVNASATSTTSVQLTVNGVDLTGDTTPTVKIYGGTEASAPTETSAPLMVSATVDANTTLGGFQINVTGLVAATNYRFYATQTVDGEETAKTSLFNVTTATAASPTAVVSSQTDGINTGNVVNVLDANDSVVLQLSGPVSLASGASVTLVDLDGTEARLVSGTNATFTLGGASSNVVTMVLSGAPTVDNFGTNGLLNVPVVGDGTVAGAAITGTTGITNATGGVNLAASGLAGATGRALAQGGAGTNNDTLETVINTANVVVDASAKSVTIASSGTNEVQTIAAGDKTGGTFTLTYAAQTTTAIAFNATAATIDTALEALSNIGVGDVTVTGGPIGTTAAVVTFTGALASTNVVPLTIDSTLLTGGATFPTIAQTTAGVAGLLVDGATVRGYSPSTGALVGSGTAANGAVTFTVSGTYVAGDVLNIVYTQPTVGVVVAQPSLTLAQVAVA